MERTFIVTIRDNNIYCNETENNSSTKNDVTENKSEVVLTNDDDFLLDKL